LKVRVASKSDLRRLAIRPYPRRLEEEIEFAGHRVVLRPIRPEDEPAHREWFARLQPDDIRFRFLGLLRELIPSELARFTQIDYEREMAFIATQLNGEGQAETLGVARVATDPDNVTGEFAIIVRSDLKGKGLGSALLEKLIRYCRERGTSRIVSRFLPDNTRMVNLVKKFGFQVSDVNVDDVLDAELKINE
jgi:acetyltransferase